MGGRPGKHPETVRGRRKTLIAEVREAHQDAIDALTVLTEEISARHGVLPGLDGSELRGCFIEHHRLNLEAPKSASNPSELLLRAASRKKSRFPMMTATVAGPVITYPASPCRQLRRQTTRAALRAARLTLGRARRLAD